MVDQKEYLKEWRLKNRAKITEKYQEYMKANPEKFKTQTACECGGHYVYQAKGKHLKSKMHLLHLERIAEAV